MEEIQLSFGKINILGPQLAEVIINEGLDFSLEMFNEEQAILRNRLGLSYGLLVNRLHSYAYSFDAIRAIQRESSQKATAVINSNHAGDVVIKLFEYGVPEHKMNLRQFSDRQDAINWLNKKIQTI